MNNRSELKGMKFGKLTVIDFYGVNKKNNSLWKCKCDCGNESIVFGLSLKSGHTRSCGCLRREKASKMFKKHGGVGTRLYTIYYRMIERCYKPKNNSYRWYGSKGIKVCEEWRNDFATFKRWAYENGYREEKGLPKSECLSIDRIDPNKDYCPDNCRWITLSENVARTHNTNKDNTNKENKNK